MAADKGNGKNGNLCPPASLEEARRRGAAGGNKSGEARRTKKLIVEKLQTMLNRRVANPKVKEQLCKDFAKDSKTYGDAMIAAQIYQAIKGNTKAFNAIINLLPDEKDDYETSKTDDEYSVGDLIDALTDRYIKGVDDADDEDQV